jgi:hypothetical protein
MHGAVHDQDGMLYYAVSSSPVARDLVLNLLFFRIVLRDCTGLLRRGNQKGSRAAGCCDVKCRRAGTAAGAARAASEDTSRDGARCKRTAVT